MEPITVDIWSDIACPWCFIGKRKFELALTDFAALPTARPVQVEYHSFELAPETPVDFAGSELAFLVQHKGIPVAEARLMLNRVTEIAAQVGLRYDFDALQHTNTVLAHQFLQFAKSRGLQSAGYERLFRAYFEEGRHVGRAPELVALGADIGLDPAQTADVLRRAEFLPAVRTDQQAAAARGIRGVPYFLFNGFAEVRGAADSADFLQTLSTVGQ